MEPAVQPAVETLAAAAGSGGDYSLLTALVILPTLGALALMLVPKEQTRAHWWIGILTSVVVFLVSLPLLTGFDNTEPGFQWTQYFDWISSIGAGWYVGIDGISLWIVLLTTFLTPIILAGSTTAITKRVREFIICMLILESGMIGALVATDLLLFFLFWELMLVPMYLLIGIWGGKERIYATVKFFIYTVVGSLLMLIGIIYLQQRAGGTFDYDVIMQLQLTDTEQFWLFSAFSLAFLIKVPVFPFHTWLPDAHTQAPTAGSVVLAGVLLKMGTYGFLRFGVALFPSAMATYSPVIVVLSVIGIVYGAMMAFAQDDVKKLVAYSSVSHLGFVMLGIVALNETAVEGAILQMVNHGISTGALFLLVGVIYERTHTREIRKYGGIAAKVPVFTSLFIIVTMSSIGLPTTNGFVGEFMILSGSMKEGLPIYPGFGATSWPVLTVAGTVLAATGVVLGAVYMLTVVRKVFFGPQNPETCEGLQDMSLREVLVASPLIAFVFIIGLFPNAFLKPMHASVRNLVGNVDPIVREIRDKERQDLLRGKRSADSGKKAEIRVAGGAR